MSNCQLPGQLVALLQNSGVTATQIREATFDTRVYHDLGMFGDTACWLIDELSKIADMSEFEFEKYFPPEFHGKGLVKNNALAMLPFANWVLRKRGEYAPLTLGMLAKCIEAEKWISVGSLQETNLD